MIDKPKSVLDNTNVHRIPPKSFAVRHKGLRGTVTYDPDTKKWKWTVNMLIPMEQHGEEETQEQATLAVKRILDTAASAGNNVRTID